MKRAVCLLFTTLVTLALVLSGSYLPGLAQPPDPAGQPAPAASLTYSGYLMQAGVPVSGACDLQFSLWSARTGGKQAAGVMERPTVAVSDGYFSVSDLGFGASMAAGSWLEMAVRCPAGVGEYVTPTALRRR